jgi:signal peptidase I
MNINTKNDVATEASEPRRTTAVVLSLFLTGLGHLAAGHGRRGAAWFCLTVAAMAAGHIAAGIGNPWLWWFVLVMLLTLHVISAFETLRLKRPPVLPGVGVIAGVWVGAIVIVKLLSVGAHALFSDAFEVPAASMYPTLLPGDHIVASKLRAPEPGNAVVFRYPPAPDVSYVKRVVATGGETVEIRRGQLLVNGREVPRRRTEMPCSKSNVGSECTIWQEALAGRTYFVATRSEEGTSFGPLTVPQGSVFVLSDNRENGADSRVYGPIPLGNVQGRAVFIWWSSDKTNGIRWSRINARI